MASLHRVVYVLSALPLFWVAWRLLTVWTNPAALSDAHSWVRFGVALMILEFILLHSGIFVVVGFAAADKWWQRALLMLGLVAFYGLFALGLALGTDSKQVLQIYGFVILGRFVTLVVDRDAGSVAIFSRSLLGTLIYLPLVFASVLLPWPRFALVGEYAAAARTEGSSGIWIDDPHRAIGAAFVYFLAMGCLEIYLGFKGEERRSQ